MSCGRPKVTTGMLPAGCITCPPITITASVCPSPGCPSPCSPSCDPPCCPPSCCPSPCCPPVSRCGPPSCLGQGSKMDTPCGPRVRREKRWKQCNFLKPCIDTRIYRNGEAMCISFAGHIPGEQYIHGRNLPTTTTFAKRRLCQYTPYEFVDPDGCCSFCTYP